MTEERLQCHGTSYGRDFLSTSDGDDYHLERDNEYKKFISEKKKFPYSIHSILIAETITETQITETQITSATTTTPE